MFRTLDLFSGIGGFSLGLERTGGFTTVAFCEIDGFCRKVLKKHWPTTPIFHDIRDLRGDDVGPVDVVCGGFPCQPFSAAARGRTRGREDNRFLWPEMLRLVDELRPTWVIGENVTHIDRVALDQVVSDLEAIGFQVAPPLEIPACAVGLDHHRPRLWFLGHADSDSKPRLPIDAEVAGLSWRRSVTGSARGPHGVPSRVDRLRALGNAVVPQIPELIGRAILASEQARAA
jgi:DNA (cytosine-5)-methyltransferase 1